MKLRNDQPDEHGASPAPYPDAEMQFVRERFKLPQDENAGPWCAYCREWSSWRERCNELITWILTNPDAYIRDHARLKNRKGGSASAGWRSDLGVALDELRSQLMEYARPGQHPLSLALEILGQMQGQRRCRVLIRDLIAGGWLPKEPRNPRDTARERQTSDRARRSGITHEQRMVNAETLAEAMGP